MLFWLKYNEENTASHWHKVGKGKTSQTSLEGLERSTTICENHYTKYTLAANKVSNSYVNNKDSYVENCVYSILSQVKQILQNHVYYS